MSLPQTFRVDAPLLRGPAVFDQEWRDLTFIHWSVEPEVIAPMLPAGTYPDTYDGKTYVGLVPFHMRHAGMGRNCPTPWLGDFPETNVRLYSVDDEGRHGVVFRSLESARLVTTLAARWGYRIPYAWSAMRIGRYGTRFRYMTRRRWPDKGLRFAATVQVGQPLPDPTELDTFLTARWGLHSTLAGRTVWIPNWHRPWRLHQAELVSLADELVAASGVEVHGAPDVPARFAPGVRTVFGLPHLI